MKHIIKNHKSLATTKIRRDAIQILEQGIAAINTEGIIKKSVKYSGNKLTIQGKKYDLTKFDNIYVIGIGKASYDAAKELESILGSRITNGVVIDVKNGGLKHVKSFAGTHPIPSEVNAYATNRILEVLRRLNPDDLVITIISGGGSALLSQPFQLRHDELSQITHELLRSGASIHEINTVRKHLSLIQGGQLARLAYPATVAALIFSDVPGDELDTIASGPTILDKTTAADATEVLKKYKILKICKLPGCELIETPKNPIYFKKVNNFLVVSNQLAVDTMKTEAKKLGYLPRVFSTTLQGEASVRGRELAQMAKSGQALIAAGETVVTVQGNGKGGRNQEFTLGALPHLPPDTLVASIASDGIDNSEVAGAIVDDEIMREVKRRRLKPEAVLKRNDSFNFFAKLGNQIETGITGTNVSDLMLVLRK